MFKSLIFVMSLSGSLIALFWIIIHRLCFFKFKAKWLRNMILMAIPFFLLPVPLLRNFIFKPLLDTGMMPTPLAKDIEGALNKTYIALAQGNIASLSIGEQIILLVIGIAPIISCAFIIRQAHSYVKLYAAIRHHVRLPLSRQEKKTLLKTKDEMQINKEIRLIKSSAAITPFTLGIIHPVIVIPKDLPTSKDTLTMVFAHELAHIQHRDALFTLISCVIMAMHWFNPFCIIYLRAFKEANELYSDETVMDTFSYIDKLAYCHLLIQLANKNDSTNCMFTLSFSSESAKRQLLRRMNNIIRHKKQKFRMAMTLSFLMLNVGLGSSLLYAGTEKIQIENTQEIISFEEDLEFKSTCFNTKKNDTNLSSSDIKIPYDTFFIDGHNNLFPYDNTSTNIYCTHSYISGTVMTHEKNDTRCQMNYYHAKRCEICGATITFDLYKTETWPICPH